MYMNFIDKLRSIVFGPVKTQIQLTHGEKALEIIKNRSAILQELNLCKEKGRLVGIYAGPLGDGMFLTGIEDIYKWEKETIIVLKPYDIGGNILQRNYLSLSEIKGVCPFIYTYKNPFVNLAPAEDLK